MKMREMRKEKISWVKRETKRTRKLPSKATMVTTMMMSQKPIQTRPVRYSMSFDVQNCEHRDIKHIFFCLFSKSPAFLTFLKLTSYVVYATYTVKGFFKDQQRSREAHNQQWLSPEQTEDHPLH